jgi:hypothetical protein
MRQGIRHRCCLLAASGWRGRSSPRSDQRWRRSRRKRRLSATISLRSFQRRRFRIWHRRAKRRVPGAKRKSRAKDWCWHLARYGVTRQIRSANGYLRFIGRRIRTSKHGAAAVLGVAVCVMRRAAARAIFPFALRFSYFGPAIRADRIQFRCLS